MKSAEVPKGAIIAVVAALAIIIGFFAYTSFLKPAPQVDPSKVPAERLLDPDHRPASR